MQGQAGGGRRSHRLEDVAIRDEADDGPQEHVQEHLGESDHVGWTKGAPALWSRNIDHDCPKKR